MTGEGWSCFLSFHPGEFSLFLCQRLLNNLAFHPFKTVHLCEILINFDCNFSGIDSIVMRKR